MDKLLHERLREWGRMADPILTAYDDFGMSAFTEEYEGATSPLFMKIADEIERYYIPRPRFEDGEPVQFGENGLRKIEYHWCYIPFERHVLETTLHYDDGEETLLHEGEFVKSPTPKVLDADGVEIKAGQEVYGTGREQHRYIVLMPHDECNSAIFTVKCRDLDDEGVVCHCAPSQLTHEKPVFDAEGVRVCKGDTVWHKESGEEYEVIDTPFSTLGCLNNYLRNKRTEHLWFCDPSKLTHREPDNIHKLMDDATKPQRQYYNDFIGHDVGLRDDEEINVAVHTHIINRAMDIAKRNQC